MDFIKELNKDLQNGFSKRDLEKLIGLPKNSLSNILRGNKKLSQKSKIKVGKWAASKKPDPLSILHTEKGVIEVNSKNGFIDKFTPDVKQEENKDYSKEFPLNKVDDGYNFDGKKFLVIEDYTAYPMKAIPKNQIQAQMYLKEKKAADNKIREAWVFYKSQLNQ